MLWMKQEAERRRFLGKYMSDSEYDFEVHKTINGEKQFFCE